MAIGTGVIVTVTLSFLALLVAVGVSSKFFFERRKREDYEDAAHQNSASIPTRISNSSDKNSRSLPVADRGALLGIERLHSDYSYPDKIVNDRPGIDEPKLRCLIIGSPGDQAPLPGSYLPGVCKDVNEIQEMLKGDPSKEISMVPQDGFTSNNLLSLSICKEYIKKQMEDIKLASHNHSNGLLIWYTGHGKRDTGDWVMQDDLYLKFEDVYKLYKNCFKGRPLYIVADCCYSGAWVVTCASLFDRDGIKCGESAGINIKVFASCLHTESAIDKLYIEGKGVRLLRTNKDKERSKTICFAEHRELCDKDGDTQITLGVDFTRYKHCVKRKGTCCHIMTWNEHVLELVDGYTTREYLK